MGSNEVRRGHAGRQSPPYRGQSASPFYSYPSMANVWHNPSDAQLPLNSFLNQHFRLSPILLHCQFPRILLLPMATDTDYKTDSQM